MKPSDHSSTFSDLRGASRIAIDAVAGVTDIVEAMHRNIAGLAPVVGREPAGSARGIPGMVYSSVRGVTQMVGLGLDAVLGQLTPLLRHRGKSAQREAVQAALNGVLGDYLAASGNPLAIPMQLRHHGRALVLERAALEKEFSTAASAAAAKLVVLVHGLCMNDLQWQRDGHDHGAALAQDLGYTPLYLHYNSGRHIAVNGAQFSELLDTLVQQWPAAITELTIIGHSMGGLVTRSACLAAKEKKPGWLKHLKKIVFLGTPHHGAPLERAGNMVDLLLGISPYTAPFARLGKVRSAGVQDLRHGSLFADAAHIAGAPVALPARVRCYAVAATKQEKTRQEKSKQEKSKQAAATSGAGKSTARKPALDDIGRLRGDGLVPVKSALGRHDDAARALRIPASRQALCYGLDHFDLLSSLEVYGHLKGWLSEQ